MIHFSPMGETDTTVCGKPIGKGLQLYTENERLTDCAKCMELLGLHTEDSVQERKRIYDKLGQ
jgi:hypothetical protein